MAYRAFERVQPCADEVPFLLNHFSKFGFGPGNRKCLMMRLTQFTYQFK